MQDKIAVVKFCPRRVLNAFLLASSSSESIEDDGVRSARRISSLVATRTSLDRQTAGPCLSTTREMAVRHRSLIVFTGEQKLRGV